jgi:hypothetical protein
MSPSYSSSDYPSCWLIISSHTSILRKLSIYRFWHTLTLDSLSIRLSAVLSLYGPCLSLSEELLSAETYPLRIFRLISAGLAKLSFCFMIIYTFGRTPWTGDQPVARPLPTHGTTQTQSKRIQASVTRVWFEPTIPRFESVKTVHSLDRAATVIGSKCK